jgi:uncharacterized repeat protein (TIGR02543 family)
LTGTQAAAIGRSLQKKTSRQDKKGRKTVKFKNRARKRLRRAAAFVLLAAMGVSLLPAGTALASEGETWTKVAYSADMTLEGEYLLAFPDPEIAGDVDIFSEWSTDKNAILDAGLDAGDLLEAGSDASGSFPSEYDRVELKGTANGFTIYNPGNQAYMTLPLVSSRRQATYNGMEANAEKFTLEDAGDGNVYLKTSYGRYFFTDYRSDVHWMEFSAAKPQWATPVTLYKISKAPANTSAYTLYLTNDAAKDGVVNVDPGQTVTLNLMAESTADVDMTMFDTSVTAAGLIRTSVDPDMYVLSVGSKQTDANTVYLQKALNNTDKISLSAKTPALLATITYTVPQDATGDFPVTLGDSQLAVQDPNDIEPKIPSLKGLTLRVNTQTVTFTDPAGVIADSVQTVGKGNKPQAPAAQDRRGYTFAGWSDGSQTYAAADIPAATADVTYTAQWTKNTYTLTFKDENGKVIGTLDYDVDTKPQDLQDKLPAVPDKTGYSGQWADLDLDSLTSHDVTPIYTTDTYTLTFKNGQDTVAQLDYTVESDPAQLQQQVPAVPEKTGYTGTWSAYDLKALVNEPENTVIEAQYSPIAYKVTFLDENGAVVKETTHTVETTTVEEPAVPDKTGYDGVWENYDLTAPADLTVKPVYTYKLTFLAEDGTVVKETTHTVETTAVDEPAVPEKAGYTGAWETYDKAAAADVTVHPVYTAVTYTITYQGQGVDADTAKQTYTIESSQGLTGKATKANYTFQGWKVVQTAGNWPAAGQMVDITSLKGCYGDVTLEAVWTFSASLAVEDYGYARIGDKLLIVADNLADGQSYAYKGAKMYWTDDANYVSSVEGATGVFVTIVSPKADGTYDQDLSVVAEPKESLARGQINAAPGYDLGDVNAIVNMINEPAYYSYSVVSIKSRLNADMVTAKDGTTNRASIADAVAVLDKFNGK